MKTKMWETTEYSPKNAKANRNAKRVEGYQTACRRFALPSTTASTGAPALGLCKLLPFMEGANSTTTGSRRIDSPPFSKSAFSKSKGCRKNKMHITLGVALYCC